MTYSILDIIIKPKLDMSMVYFYVKEMDLATAYQKYTESVNDMKEGLKILIDVLGEVMKSRRFKKEFLEKVGRRVLEYAKKNAEIGYNAGQATYQGQSEHGSSDWSWTQRAEITKKLYKFMGYDPYATGLTTGADMLLNSLVEGNRLNIFDVKPDKGEVTIGTRFFAAKILEEGGYRHPDDFGTHLGFVKDDATGQIVPSQRLVWGIQRELGMPGEKGSKGHKEAIAIAMSLYDELKEVTDAQGVAYIPPRPYLKPALWYVYAEGKYKEIFLMEFDLEFKLRSDKNRSSLRDSIESIETHLAIT